MKLLIFCAVVLPFVSVVSSSDAICEKYVECEQAYNAQIEECGGNGLVNSAAFDSNITECQQVIQKQTELNELTQKKSEDELKCVADVSARASTKPSRGCARVSSKIAKGEEVFGVAGKKVAARFGRRRIAAAKDSEKVKSKQCARSAQVLLAECRGLQRCCAASKGCAKNAQKNPVDVRNKKKELRDAIKACKKAKNAVNAENRRKNKGNKGGKAEKKVNEKKNKKGDKKKEEEKKEEEKKEEEKKEEEKKEEEKTEEEAVEEAVENTETKKH